MKEQLQLKAVKGNWIRSYNNGTPLGEAMIEVVKHMASYPEAPVRINNTSYRVRKFEICNSCGQRLPDKKEI